MVDAKELAKEIYGWCFIAYEADEKDDKESLSRIESLLEKALAEAEARFFRDASVTTEHEKNIRSEAIEECAKIAEIIPINPDYMTGDELKRCTRIAMQIRQLAREGKK